MIGCAVATAMVYYNNRFLGKLVRALIDIDATSPESAISAQELGIKITPALSRALRPDSSFSEIVIKTADGRYYIAPDRLSLAKVKFRGKDTTIIFVLLTFIILALVTLALTYIFPEAIESFTIQFNAIFGEEAKI